MKILHIGEKIYGGGAENVFYRTISSFTSFRNYEMDHYFAFKSHPKIDILPDLDFNFQDNHLSKKISSIYSLHNYRVLSKYLYSLQPDIIHLQLIGNLSPSVLGAVYKYKIRYKKVKVIQTVHSFEHVCSHHAAYDYRNAKRCLDCMNDRYKLRIFYRFCSRAGGLHSFAKGCVSLIGDYYFNRKIIDVYIAPSQFLASLLNKRYRDAHIEVVKNPVFALNVPPTNKTDIITYFGRLSEEKDLELFIKSIPYVLEQMKIRVRIIGDGPAKQELMDFVKSEKLMEIFDFIPYVTQKELFTLIADAKVFVLTSKLFETFSLVIYESIMAGLIPVVPSHGALQEGVEWLQCGLLYESGNYLNLADKIIEAVKGYDSYISGLKKAQEKIEIELNAQRYINSLLSIYQHVSKETS